MRGPRACLSDGPDMRRSSCTTLGRPICPRWQSVAELCRGVVQRCAWSKACQRMEPVRAPSMPAAPRLMLVSRPAQVPPRIEQGWAQTRLVAHLHASDVRPRHVLLVKSHCGHLSSAGRGVAYRVILTSVTETCEW